MASASPTPSTTPTPRPDHHTQYFEMLGHRAIYHDGWRAVCPWPGPSFTEAGKGFGEPISAETLSTLDGTGWELYHVAADFAENHDVAADNRDQLIAMIGTWYVEAGKYGVMPIDGSGLARMIAEKPLIALPRDTYTYAPNTQSVPNFAAPKVLNRPHSITADVEIPDEGAEGVLLSQGTAAGGYSFYVKDGKLRYVHNYVGRKLLEVESDEAVPTGKHQLRFEFEPTGPPDLQHGKGAPGRMQLYIDGNLVGNADADVHNPLHVQPRGTDLRGQPRLPGHPRLRGPVHLHRDTAQRHPRRQRRADPGPRSRTTRPPRPTVNPDDLVGIDDGNIRTIRRRFEHKGLSASSRSCDLNRHTRPSGSSVSALAKRSSRLGIAGP